MRGLRVSPRLQLLPEGDARVVHHHVAQPHEGFGGGQRARRHGVVGVVVDEAFHRRKEDREGRAEVVRGLLAARLGVFDPHLELAVGDLEIALGTVVKLRHRAL